MKKTDYSVMDILQMDACTGCSLCTDVCPAVSASENGQLSALYRLAQLRRIMRSRRGLLRRLFGRQSLTPEQLKAFSDTVFRCTLCGRCQEVCPSGIMLKNLWLSLRQDLVHDNAYPGKVDMIAENIAQSHNVFDEDNEERAEWVEDMDDAPDDGYLKDKAEVVYFTGCVSSYFPMVQSIPIAVAEIFDAAGVDFTLLGEDEWCCGFPMLGAGLADQAGKLIDHNVQAVKAKGAKKVVFSCPSCYRMWKEHYPDEFELWHVTQFMNELISSGQLVPGRLPLKVTYHDPCDLGRGGGEYAAPRQILNAIPGIELVEMEHNRENCLCCGGGGNLEMIDAGLSNDIAGAKLEEALGTGADTIITACQQCVRTMTAFARKNKKPVKVMDITQLVHDSLGYDK